MKKEYPTRPRLLCMILAVVAILSIGLVPTADAGQNTTLNHNTALNYTVPEPAAPLTPAPVLGAPAPIQLQPVPQASPGVPLGGAAIVSTNEHHILREYPRLGRTVQVTHACTKDECGRVKRTTTRTVSHTTATCCCHTARGVRLIYSGACVVNCSHG